MNQEGGEVLLTLLCLLALHYLPMTGLVWHSTSKTIHRPQCLFLSSIHETGIPELSTFLVHVRTQHRDVWYPQKAKSPRAIFFLIVY